jgi:deoxyadenosine/deoxycytidine kinase
MKRTKNKGRIISIVGAPASGKSTLIRYFRKNYKVKTFLEGEEKDLPVYIKRNIEKNKNGLQTILFFHNQTVKQYLKALQLKNKGYDVILDTFWISNLFYLDTMVPDRNEKKLIKDWIELIAKTMSLPDVIIFLKIDNKTLKDRLFGRGRKFEKDFLKGAEQISKSHNDYFKSKKRKKYLLESKIITANAKDFDCEALAKKIKLIKRS